MGFTARKLLFGGVLLGLKIGQQVELLPLPVEQNGLIM